MKHNLGIAAVLCVLLSATATAAPTTRRALPATAKAATTTATSQSVTLDQVEKSIPEEFKSAIADERGPTELMAKRINTWIWEKYRNRTLVYSGTVQSVSSHRGGVTVEFSDHAKSLEVEVNCSFPITDMIKLSDVREGDSLKVVGTVRNLSIRWRVSHDEHGEATRCREISILLEDCKQP